MTATLFHSLLSQTRRALAAGVIALACIPAVATTTFSNNFYIGVTNTNFDGMDIVVTNCTLTVDGSHTFSSMHVAAAGVLTHSQAQSGLINSLINITNEPQVLNGTNLVTLLNPGVVPGTIAVTDSTGATNYVNGVDYLTATNGNQTELQRTTNSSIPSGASVLVSYEILVITPAGLMLTISNNVAVDVGGAINANGAGHSGGYGTGTGYGNGGSPSDGSGGGYGGDGGTSSSNVVGGSAYGSYNLPANLGSGGGASYAGPGGAGGGLIQIVAGGSVIDNGSISANGGNGTNDRSGGGSGGTVSLTALTLSGSGTITANGGSGDPPHGGGGGGGRIAIQYGANSFAGSMTAYGGAGANIGGAGTVYTQETNQTDEHLTVDNGGQPGTNTPIAIGNEALDVMIQGKASVTALGSWSVGSLTIASNSVLLASPSTTLFLTVENALTIEAAGGLLANSAGPGGGNGAGAGHTFNDGIYRPCGGGGYGGPGGNSTNLSATGGPAYGVQSIPSGFGSGGGNQPPYSFGGSGGGAIQITSFSGGIVQVDGTLAANGGNGSGSAGGGGSGGTITLTGGTLLGSGSITANGGTGADSIGGGGGGGRIYINPTANNFGGTISAFGGAGGNWGGAGTAVIQVTGQNTQLILDNGGHAATNTPLQSANSTTDLIVRNGGVGTATSSVTFANLYLNSNGWLVPTINSELPASAITFTFTGNATVQAGGGIVADFEGYSEEAGPGEGRTFEVSSAIFYCSGAGHGGYGGGSFGNDAGGGITYDTPTAPIDPGSGGGDYETEALGGTGGGVIRLSVTGTLEVDGVISANGGSGSAGGGGGSGGSVWLSAGTLSGAGSIAANGGAGTAITGGGGGGGMVYIPCGNNSFLGSVTAYGGGGANWGGAGTTIIQATGKNSQLILDNGGHAGAFTPVLSSSTTDLTLRNGAMALTGESLSLGNVLISSNSWLLVSNTLNFDEAITMTSATIQPGGGIIADSEGYPAGEGNGLGHAYTALSTDPCSGAGHGGNGANSAGNYAVGGIAYDTATSPTGVGSGGGSYSTFSIGGAGGGAFSLTVAGLLQIDGSISANGGNGAGSGGGGGSGGSIKLTAGTLAGAGSITANGGSGAGSIGGGGAGGCIAVYPTTDLFSGVTSVYGGGGGNWGAAGTLYIQVAGQSGQFILNNGGQSGAATPIQTASSSAVIILSNGAVGYGINPSQTFASLTISSNAWLMPDPVANNAYLGIVNLTLTGNATIAAGGGIVTDNSASAGGSGIGAGHFSSGNSSFPCSGAGYGGSGANSVSNLATGGSAYGSATSPTSNGSGGGNTSPDSFGGAGGGSIRLTVNGTLDAEGRISANGGNGSGLGGGGGSGGSIWLTVGTLAGTGSISANGGSGANAIGGGGGGGRISIAYTANDFSGPMTAYGGGGFAYGGAGTIYTKASTQTVGQLILNNGGLIGTNTPLSTSLGTPSQPFSLTIGSGAIVSPQPATFPLLSNLTIASGGLLTILSSQSTLDLLVFNNVDVQPGGVIAVDGEGYTQSAGPGAGQTFESDGSGAGYGGAGGASAAGPGGISYGSSSQPVNFGSGGGFGFGPLAGGSQGGGAIRLSVGGILTVDGQLSAQGEPGLQDNSGGGSGGSIWATAGTLAGSGLVTANGGEGQLYDGGGGAGGRIALYSHANIFSGSATVAGGAGDSPGTSGTIYSNSVPPLQILSNSPVGVVNNAVSSVTLYFNGAPNPNSFAATAVALTTPNGALPPSSFTISMVSSASYLVSFPQQTAVGNYVLTVGPNINDLYGQPMSVAYTGGFSISLPVVQGAITNANGQPVAGVLLQASGGLSSTTTGVNGNYALGFVPGSSFIVTPSQGTLMFVPSSMSYSDVSASVSNQNYLAVPTIASVLTAGRNSTNFSINWQAIPGVNYQVYSSTNLTNWLPYGGALSGSNGSVQILVPIGSNTVQYFSVQSSD